MTFQLDTTGGVGPMPGWHKPVPTSNRFIFWFDLSPFAQDYIEALAADNFARVAAMPPKVAFAPGSIGKNRPVSRRCTFSSSRVKPGWIAGRTPCQRGTRIRP